MEPVISPREKRDARHEIVCLGPGVPAYHIVSTALDGRYRIEKDVLADPRRSVVLQRVRFISLQGSLSDYHLYALLAPHINNMGADNTAWVGEMKGVPMLFASRDDTALALASSAPWLKRSAGFVGASDGWQDLNDHFQMTWTYDRAENGNTALTGEIDLAACQGEFTLALGFGEQPMEAAHLARASLLDGFDAALEAYTAEWTAWHKTLLNLETSTSTVSPYPYQRRRPAHPRSQGFQRRDHRLALHPVGQQQGRQRSGRLSPGVDPRPGREHRRPVRRRRRRGTRRACCATCRSPRRRTGTGRRTCGWTAPPTGRASSSTKRPSPSS